MRFNFEIETPESCVACKFHLLKTDGRYGKWVFQCLIDNSIIIKPRDGITGRDKNCPGKE